MKAIIVRVLASLVFLICSLGVAQAQSSLSWIQNLERDGAQILQSSLDARASSVRTTMSSWKVDIVETVHGGDQYLYLLYEAGEAYYEQRLGRIKVESGELELIKAYEKGGSLFDLFVDETNDWVYYRTEQGIFRTRISSPEVESLVEDEETIQLWVDFAESKLYWNSNNYLMQAALDGSGAEKVHEETVGVFTVRSDGQKIYYTHGGSAFEIKEFDLQSKEIKFLYTSEGFDGYSSPTMNSLLHDGANDMLYWIEIGYRVEFVGGRPGYRYIPKSSIFSLDSDGSVREELDGADATYFENLSVDSQGTWLFYSDTHSRVNGVRLSEGFSEIWTLEDGNNILRAPLSFSPDASKGYVAATVGIGVLDLSGETCCAIPTEGFFKVLENFYGQVARDNNDTVFYSIGALSGDILFANSDPEHYGAVPILSAVNQIQDVVYGDERMKLYYSKKEGLFQVNADGSENTQLVATEFGAGPLALSADGEDLYFIERKGSDAESTSKIQRYDISEDTTELVKDEVIVTAFTADTQNMYLFWSDGTSIQRSNLSGSEQEQLFFIEEGGVRVLQSDEARKRLYVLGADRMIRLEYNGDTTPAIELENLESAKDLYVLLAEPVRGAVPYDYDGDEVSDYTIYRPWAGGGGEFFSRQSSNGVENVEKHYFTSTPILINAYGDRRNDYVVIGDNGLDPLIFWQMHYTIPLVWGIKGDIPVPADFDGDGLDELAVYRPNDQIDEHGNAYGAWYIRLGDSANRVEFITENWGLAGDTPVPADYDGDGISDVAVWRPEFGLWLIKHSGYASGYTDQEIGFYQWGLPGDIPMAADMDNDGRAELIVWRPSNGTWYIRNTLSDTFEFRQWGLPGDVPLIGDFNGDGLKDLTVYREYPAQYGPRWYTNFRNGKSEVVQWGLPGDLLP